MEYRYQSIPHNCGILETARLKPMYGEYLEFYGFGEVPFEDLQFRGADADFREYVEAAKRTREAFPGLEIRKVELNAERNALRQAIADSGSDILGVSICSTAGEPIRFLPPYVVKQIVDELDSGRFIVSSDLADVFNNLADFYRISGAFDEGVITIKL